MADATREHTAKRKAWRNATILEDKEEEIIEVVD
jgi:hypothetical protein